MNKGFMPPVFEWESPEYEAYIANLKTAMQARNARNRYVNAVRKNKPNPFDHVPPKPTAKQLRFMESDLHWNRWLRTRPDKWWFRRISKSVEDNFYRSKVACLIWWELVQHRDHGLSREAWHQRFDHYDFDRDLHTDWDMVEYALHCCGFPPTKAREMCFEAMGRKRLKKNVKHDPLGDKTSTEPSGV